jgi:hypothetical protein
MVNIELTPLQVAELKNFYMVELEKLEKRTDEIRGLLSKLNKLPVAAKTRKNRIPGNKAKNEAPDLAPTINLSRKVRRTKPKPEKKIKAKKIEPKPAVKLTEKKTDSRIKYNWPKFVVDTLNKTRRVLSAKEFIQHAVVAFNLSKHEINIAKNSISPTLSVLTSKAKTLKTVKKEGQKAKSFGLTTWFEDGKLLAVYK